MLENDKELRELLEYLTQNAVPLEDFGAYVAISKDGILFDCPMLADGSPEMGDNYPECYAFGEVTAPDPELLEAVNTKFGTSYSMKQFAGR